MTTAPVGKLVLGYGSTIKNLRNLLREAVEQIKLHNASYHHLTEGELLERLEAEATPKVHNTSYQI